MCKRKPWVENRAGLWLNHPQRSWATASGEGKLEEELLLILLLPTLERRRAETLWTFLRAGAYLLEREGVCIVRTFSSRVQFGPFLLCRTPVLVLHCITVYKQPPLSLHRQHVRSDIATMESHARAAHLLNGFDANSAAWKNHRWFSFKLPWARAKLPLASVKNASISSGPAMTEGNGETRVS